MGQLFTVYQDRVKPQRKLLLNCSYFNRYRLYTEMQRAGEKWRL